MSATNTRSTPRLMTKSALSAVSQKATSTGVTIAVKTSATSVHTSQRCMPFECGRITFFAVFASRRRTPSTSARKSSICRASDSRALRAAVGVAGASPGASPPAARRVGSSTRSTSSSASSLVSTGDTWYARWSVGMAKRASRPPRENWPGGAGRPLFSRGGR